MLAPPPGTPTPESPAIPPPATPAQPAGHLLDAETEQVVPTLERICADRRKTPEAVFKGIVH